jgi:hypothetical protein
MTDPLGILLGLPQKVLDLKHISLHTLIGLPRPLHSLILTRQVPIKQHLQEPAHRVVVLIIAQSGAGEDAIGEDTNLADVTAVLDDVAGDVAGHICGGFGGAALRHDDQFVQRH